MIRVRVRPFSVPLSTPLSTAGGEISDRRGFLVAVDSAGNGTSPDGSTASGIGEATPLPGWTEPYDRCREELDHLDDLDEPLLPSTPAARHGVALARLDRDARLDGVPLAERLTERHGVGTDPADTVPVNATVGDVPPAETVARSREAVAEGFDCLKVKVGNRSLEADLDRLRAVRDAVGEAVTLRADANAAWDRETAVLAVEAMTEIDVSYVEQPLPADDLEGHRNLRGRGVGVAVDESLAVGTAVGTADGTTALERVRAALDAEAADVVVLKPMALGGPDRALQAAIDAREAGVEPTITTTIDAVVARTAAVHVAAAIPDVAACGLATGSLLAADLAPDPAPVADGRIRVPDGAGLGVDAADLL